MKPSREWALMIGALAAFIAVVVTVVLLVVPADAPKCKAGEYVIGNDGCMP